MKIAIAAPTGHVGSKLVEKLLDEGKHQLVLLSHDSSKVRDAVSRGAKALQGDLRDPKFVVESTTGCDALFWLTPPNMSASDIMAYHRQLAENAAHAIEKNRIKRVVNLSAVGANLERGAGPIAGLHEVERILNECCERTGCDITHLRAAFFQENFEVFAPEIGKSGTIALPISGNARVPMVATADIAAKACELLNDESWEGCHVKELVGPREYSFNEATKLIGDAIGKKVTYNQVSPDQARSAITRMGASPSVADSYVEMYQAFDRGLVKTTASGGDILKAGTRLEEFARGPLKSEIQRSGNPGQISGGSANPGKETTMPNDERKRQEEKRQAGQRSPDTGRRQEEERRAKEQRQEEERKRQGKGAERERRGESAAPGQSHMKPGGMPLPSSEPGRQRESRQ